MTHVDQSNAPNEMLPRGWEYSRIIVLCIEGNNVHIIYVSAFGCANEVCLQVVRWPNCIVNNILVRICVSTSLGIAISVAGEMRLCMRLFVTSEHPPQFSQAISVLGPGDR